MNRAFPCCSQALEMFYSPPSHDHPRDPEGWERAGLYEWAKDKTAAIRKKVGGG